MAKSSSEKQESVEDVIKRRKPKYGSDEMGHQMRKGAMAKVLLEGKVEGA